MKRGVLRTNESQHSLITPCLLRRNMRESSPPGIHAPRALQRCLYPHSSPHQTDSLAEKWWSLDAFGGMSLRRYVSIAEDVCETNDRQKMVAVNNVDAVHLGSSKLGDDVCERVG